MLTVQRDKDMVMVHIYCKTCSRMQFLWPFGQETDNVSTVLSFPSLEP